MVGIGEMPVAVTLWCMPVRMGVGLSRRVPRRVIMAVMDVMAMTVGVGERRMQMLMGMALRQM
jgi:hypothetical protein